MNDSIDEIFLMKEVEKIELDKLDDLEIKKIDYQIRIPYDWEILFKKVFNYA